MILQMEKIRTGKFRHNKNHSLELKKKKKIIQRTQPLAEVSQTAVFSIQW